MASMGMRSACAATDQASTSSRCNTSPWRRPSPRAARHRCNGSRFNEFSLWRGELPTQSAPPPRGVVPGARTVATQVLTPYQVRGAACSWCCNFQVQHISALSWGCAPYALTCHAWLNLQAMDRLYASVHQAADEHFGAFYSTELGGITTHPAGMLVHIDDHMVHAGDAVFDTALLVDGHLYQLHQHLLRFKRSAYMAGLPLPLSDPLLLRVILDTAAASRMKNGEQQQQEQEHSMREQQLWAAARPFAAYLLHMHRKTYIRPCDFPSWTAFAQAWSSFGQAQAAAACALIGATAWSRSCTSWCPPKPQSPAQRLRLA